MAGNDQMDQDAIAAQWEASMANEDPAEAEKAAAANEISGTMALQWAAMVEDDFSAQFHLRQRRSLARSHHLGALRRLHELDRAAGRAVRIQGGGVGQF